MNNQENQSINESGNKRNYVLRTMFLSIVGLALAVFTMQVKAETVQTTVQIKDQFGIVTGGRVTVFDSRTGRQIANGQTVRRYYGTGSPDNGKADFTFTSSPGQEFIVVALSSNDPSVGGGRGVAGQLIQVYALQRIALMEIVHADTDGDAVLSYVDENGAPLKKAKVVTVEWGTFGNARRGKTDAQGQYLFTDPKDLAGSDFLVVEWKNDSEIFLTAIVTGDHEIPGGDDDEGS